MKNSEIALALSRNLIPRKRKSAAEIIKESCSGNDEFEERRKLTWWNDCPKNLRWALIAKSLFGMIVVCNSIFSQSYIFFLLECMYQMYRWKYLIIKNSLRTTMIVHYLPTSAQCHAACGRFRSLKGVPKFHTYHRFVSSFSLYITQFRQKVDHMIASEGNIMLETDITVEKNIVKMFPLKFSAV